jgi:oligopeptide transport system permease protein
MCNTMASTSRSAETPTSGDKYEPYRKLLREAEAVRGVSLWQDAWRRLKRNRVAMASLGFLIVLATLALFTPLLPFQSPTLQDVENREFERPNVRPRRLALVDVDKETRTLTELLAIHRAELERLAAEGDAPGYEARLAAHPYQKFWTPLYAHDRWLTSVRVRIFGDWAFPSILGADALGRDLLSRIFWGARVSLMVGITAALVSLVVGVSWGATAGYVGGWVDALMMRVVDTLYAIPFLFIAIYLISILSEETLRARLEAWHVNRIVIFYIVIGLFYWFTMARVVRGQVISLKNEQFVDAARTVGAGTGRIIFRHLVPNVLGVVIVYLTLTIPSVMLFEAILSFLGLGVEPPDVSWGLLAEQGVRVITPIRTYWWLVLFPSVALAMTLFALNFLGDGLRDALDPRLKNR